MNTRRVRIFSVGLTTLVLLACSSTAPGGTTRSGDTNPGGGSAPAAQSGPSGTLKVAWATEPETLSPKLASGSGLNEYNWVFNSTLTYYDFEGVVHPLIAKEIPTQENGGWVIRPDGTMTTTYHLRDNVTWHDGTPLTADDYVFAFQVYLSNDIPVRDRTPETSMSGVEAADPGTLVVNWAVPYIHANILGYQQLDPLPRHILADKFARDHGTFVVGDEWTRSYVGTGPFRIESWNPGSGMIAKANPNWFMGPPKLATIDVRFVSDSNTILANLLSGEVDFINSPGVRGTDAVVAREQWVSKGQGYLKTWAVRMRYLEWQQKPVPNWQQALTDVRVRKGLEYAIDRQGLVDALNQGLGTPADTFILPADPAFGQVSQAVTKYPYDPQRAAASLADAGYRAAQPGSPLLNAQGQPLAIDVWTTAGDNGEKEIAIISDAWKAIGVGGGLFIIPSARQRDNELRQSFPGAETTARSVSADNFIFTADNVPTAANKYAGANRGGFSDPDVERLQHTVLTSFDDAERTRATIALHQRMTDVLGIGPLYYDVEVILAKNKVKGPVGNYGPQQGITWNIYDWSVSE